MAQQYVQLLGTDVPNSCGGCCFYGPLVHDALRVDFDPALTSTLPASLHNNTSADASGAPLYPSFSSSRNGYSNSNGGCGGSAGSDGYILFNCPEGTQRFSSEANVKLTKIKGVFFTRWGASTLASSAAAYTPMADRRARQAAALSHTSMISRTVEDTAGTLRHSAHTIHAQGKGSPLASADSTANSCDCNDVYGTKNNCESRRSCDNDADSIATSAYAVHGASAVMGLPGLLFTINDAGVRHVNFFGPSSAVHARVASTHETKEQHCVRETAPARVATTDVDTHNDTSYTMTDRIVTSNRNVCGTGRADCAVTSPASSGLENFLDVLRRHYFTYRTMTLRILYPRHRWSDNSAGHHPSLSFDAPSKQVGILTSTLPAPRTPHRAPPHHPVARPCSAAPFIVTSMLLNAQTALIVFRVSRAVSIRVQSGLASACTESGRKSSDLFAAGASCGGATNMQELRETVCDCNHRSHYDPHSKCYSCSFCSLERDGYEESAGCVFGYALVTAPPAKFDVQLARQCGVKPGRDYGVLKEGSAVFVSDCGKPSATRNGRSAQSGSHTAQGGHLDRTRSCTNTSTSDMNSTVDRGDRVDDGTRDAQETGMNESHGRWVQPFEVMRGTVASACVYITLVLDGNTVADVQQAVGRLLGTRVCDASMGSCEPNKSARREREGELFTVLKAHYPHLLYTTSSSVSLPSASPTVCEQPRRHAVLRHVVHVQPHSFFASNDKNELCAYRSYLRAVFADVDDAVHLSREPSLCFGVADAADGWTELNKVSCADVSVPSPVDSRKDDHDNCIDNDSDENSCTSNNNANGASSLRNHFPYTRHLFTSFVSRHYTAFPSALVHRYHLHDIASSLFPIPAEEPQRLRAQDTAARADSAVKTAAQTSSANAQAEKIANTRQQTAIACTQVDPVMPTPMEKKPPTQDCFWPYSFKYRCFPEADAATWLHNDTASSIGQSTHSAPASAGMATSSCVGSISDQARTRCVSVGGLTGLLRYPTQQSARTLLSHTFQPPTAVPLSASSRTSSSTTDENETPNAINRAMTTGAHHDDAASPHSNETMDCVRADGGGALSFLGTGSSVPSKYRNVSGAFLELHLPAACLARRSCSRCENHSSARGVIVLDFGEGSSGQLSALLCVSPLQSPPSLSCSVSCQDDALRQWMRDVMLVFISHGHADHHLGLLSLLTLRHEYRMHESAKKQQQHQSRDKTSAMNKLTCANGGDGNNFDDNRNGCSSEDTSEDEDMLLVVCPEEVHTFIMQSWGDTLPYATWLTTECRFEILPSTSMSTPNSLDASLTAEDIPSRHHRQEDSIPFTGDSTENGISCEEHNSPQPLRNLNAWCATLNASCQRVVAAQGEFDPGRDSAGCLLPLPPKQSNSSSALLVANGNTSTNHMLWWDAAVVAVDHPANAHGLLLRFPHCSATSPGVLSSRTFLFSGDTRPSTALVHRVRAFCGAGENLFICLHEATFGPGYELEARQKRHSTLPEAIAVGQAMRASAIVLNHFSQRYPVLPGLAPQQLAGSRVNLHCRRRHTSTSTTTFSPVAAEAAAATVEPEANVQTSEVNHDIHNETNSRDAGQPMCFAFDLMQLSFAALECGTASSLTPEFVRLLEEYESWGAGTTKRLRE